MIYSLFTLTNTVIISIQCYSHLTEWQDLEKAVIVNIDDGTNPKLDKIWEDSYHQVCMHVMHILSREVICR